MLRKMSTIPAFAILLAFLYYVNVRPCFSGEYRCSEELKSDKLYEGWTVRNPTVRFKPPELHIITAPPQP